MPVLLGRGLPLDVVTVPVRVRGALVLALVAAVRELVAVVPWEPFVVRVSGVLEQPARITPLATIARRAGR